MSTRLDGYTPRPRDRDEAVNSRVRTISAVPGPPSLPAHIARHRPPGPQGRPRTGLTAAGPPRLPNVVTMLCIARFT